MEQIEAAYIKQYNRNIIRTEIEALIGNNVTPALHEKMMSNIDNIISFNGNYDTMISMPREAKRVERAAMKSFVDQAIEICKRYALQEYMLDIYDGDDGDKKFYQEIVGVNPTEQQKANFKALLVSLQKNSVESIEAKEKLENEHKQRILQVAQFASQQATNLQLQGPLMPTLSLAAQNQNNIINNWKIQQEQNQQHDDNIQQQQQQPFNQSALNPLQRQYIQEQIKYFAQQTKKQMDRFEHPSQANNSSYGKKPSLPQQQQEQQSNTLGGYERLREEGSLVLGGGVGQYQERQFFNINYPISHDEEWKKNERKEFKINTPSRKSSYYSRQIILAMRNSLQQMNNEQEQIVQARNNRQIEEGQQCTQLLHTWEKNLIKRFHTLPQDVRPQFREYIENLPQYMQEQMDEFQTKQLEENIPYNAQSRVDKFKELINACEQQYQKLLNLPLADMQQQQSEQDYNESLACLEEMSLKPPSKQSEPHQSQFDQNQIQQAIEFSLQQQNQQQQYNNNIQQQQQAHQQQMQQQQIKNEARRRGPQMQFQSQIQQNQMQQFQQMSHNIYDNNQYPRKVEPLSEKEQREFEESLMQFQQSQLAKKIHDQIQEARKQSPYDQLYNNNQIEEAEQKDSQQSPLEKQPFTVIKIGARGKHGQHAHKQSFQRFDQFGKKQNTGNNNGGRE